MGNSITFEKFFYDNYYGVIAGSIEEFITGNKNSLSDDKISNAQKLEFEGMDINGVSFKKTSSQEDENLSFRIDVLAYVSADKRYYHDHEDKITSMWLSLEASCMLNDGMKNFKITSVEEYSKKEFDGRNNLSRSLVPYLYVKDADDVAEQFLKEYCPAALENPMRLPAVEVAANMGLEIYSAPLENNICGKIYFDPATEKIYKKYPLPDLIEANISEGTILIDPDCKFGTLSNTIIHECVHWKWHRLFFEMKKLLTKDPVSMAYKESGYSNKTESKATEIDWIEWQANELAPKILMPASMTRKYIKDKFAALRRTTPENVRDAELFQQTIDSTAAFFNVSRSSAKLRAAELGFEQAKGVFVYVDGKYIKPFSFDKNALGKNETFVINSVSTAKLVIDSPDLYALLLANKIVFVNNMLCINNEKYIQYDKEGFPSMTRYALDHADECCLVFKRERKYDRAYDDSYGNLGFLCREISADFFVENDVKNETYEERKKELSDEANKKDNDNEAKIIKKVMSSITELEDTFDKLPGSLSKTIDYHIRRKGYTANQLNERTQLSEQFISNLRNNKVRNIKLQTLMKLFVGLNLAPAYCFDLMNKAQVDFPHTTEGFIFMDLVMCHTDETLEQWQKYLDEIESPKIKLYDKKRAEKDQQNWEEREKSKKRKVHKFHKIN